MFAAGLAAGAITMALVASGCSSGSGGHDSPTGAAEDSEASPTAPAQPPPPTSQVRFHDVAADVGLDFRDGAFHWGVTGDPVAAMGRGLCWIDYDGDGWMDLYVVNSYAQNEKARWDRQDGLPRNALFHNVHGHFVDVSAKSGTDVATRGTGCVAADLDLDGSTDLYVTSDRVGVLLWNRGDGTFSEGAVAAGVDAVGWYAGAAVGDVDGNGWPDLFLAGYANVGNRIPNATQGFPNTHTGVRDLLYLNQGTADSSDERSMFREVGRDAGLEVANFEYGLGALLSDLDHDADLDLYVANDTKPNRLYKNVAWPGGAEADPAGLGFRFEEMAGRAGVADPNAGMGIAEGDYDGDGRDDLFVTNARGQVHSLYHGQRSDKATPSFADVRADVGADFGTATGWGVTWADLDNDTDLDLVVADGAIPVTDLAADAQPMQAFENRTAQGDPGTFADDTRQRGLDAVGPLLGRGSAAADFDNDGDVDIAVATVGGPLCLLRNDGAQGHWLEVSLPVPTPGTRIIAVLPDGRKLGRELHAGASYLSSDDPRAHFGLGAARRVSRLEIRLPDGRKRVLRDVSADQVLSLDSPRPRPPESDR